MTAQISPTTNSTNPLASPLIEYGFAIKSQSDQIIEIQSQLIDLKKVSKVSESLCHAYDDLHKLRFISLIALPTTFLVLIIIYLFSFGERDEAFHWLFRIAGIPTAIGLLIEAFWLPSKIKMTDEKVKDIKDALAGLKSDLTTLRADLNSAHQRSTSSGSASATQSPPSRSKPAVKTAPRTGRKKKP